VAGADYSDGGHGFAEVDLEVITRFKLGVRLEPSSVTARLLSAVDRVAANSPFDLWVTSAAEAHPAGDVHTLGNALDLRTHDFEDEQKRDVLRAILWELADEPPDDVSTLNNAWLALETDDWFAMLEDYKGNNEHLHVQLRHGAIFE